MWKISRLCIIFFFGLVLATSIFAQEATEEVKVSDEVVISDEDIVAVPDSDEGVVIGKVVSLDTISSSIVVKTEDGREQTFSVVDGETILWKGIDDIELADITTGEEAEVGYYTDEGGNLIASWVDIIVEEEVIPLASETEAE